MSKMKYIIIKSALIGLRINIEAKHMPNANINLIFTNFWLDPTWSILSEKIIDDSINNTLE